MSDDDVPDLATATGRNADGEDTTAAAATPAASTEDEEDRTVRQAVDPKLRNAARNAIEAERARAREQREREREPVPPQVATPPPRPPPPAPPIRITSKKMTAVGLGAPMSPATRPAADLAPGPETPPAPTPAVSTGAPPTPQSAPASTQAEPAVSTSREPETQADVADDSITATQPAPRVGPGGVPLPSGIPLSVPGTVKIRTMGVDDDPLDETEVRTVVSAPTSERSIKAALAAASSPSPAAGAPPTPPVSTAPAGETNEADEPDDSVTTQAPSPLSAGRLPEDEPKTSPPLTAPRLRPGQAATAGLGADDEPDTSQPLRAPIPAAGRRPSDPNTLQNPADDQVRFGSDADDEDGDDSVTTRGPAIGAEHEDDSVTAQAPAVPRSVAHGAAVLAALDVPPAIEDGTEGTTKRISKRRRSQKDLPKTLMSEGGNPDKPGSITAEAPGHLTNMLRVIAGDDDDDSDDDDDDDDEEDDDENSKTAVMLNAPVKPPPSGSSRAARTAISGGGGGGHVVTQHSHGSSGGGGGGARTAAAIADLRELSSDSGLRVARAEAPSGDHASLNAILAVPNAERGSGVGPTNNNGNPNNVGRRGDVAPPSPFADTFPLNAGPAPARMPEPSLHEFDFAATIKKPRYGLLVGLVAALSVAIPLILFLWLKSSPDAANGRTPAEASPDPVPRGDVVRVRATKGGPSATHSANSSSSGGGGGGGGGRTNNNNNNNSNNNWLNRRR